MAPRSRAPNSEAAAPRARPLRWSSGPTPRHDARGIRSALSTALPSAQAGLSSHDPARLPRARGTVVTIPNFHRTATAAQLPWIPPSRTYPKRQQQSSQQRRPPFISGDHCCFRRPLGSSIRLWTAGLPCARPLIGFRRCATPAILQWRPLAVAR